MRGMGTGVPMGPDRPLVPVQLAPADLKALATPSAPGPKSLHPAHPSYPQ